MCETVCLLSSFYRLFYKQDLAKDRRNVINLEMNCQRSNKNVEIYKEQRWVNSLVITFTCLTRGYTQPCTQRNIFGSHWLLSVQTLVARANIWTFLKTSIILHRFCLSVLKHCSQVSPPFTCLTIITIFALLSPPPPKKIKDCCRFSL